VPWGKGRLGRLLAAFGDRHVYMIHVGAGWAWARLHLDAQKHLLRADPLLGWLSLDGYGFHEGYFHWQRYAAGHRPARLRGYALRAFDQGLGRSAWFVFGAQPDVIAGAFAALAPERQADLWSGVGLAATYAGGADDATLLDTRRRSGAHRASLAQGCAFAAGARIRADLNCEHVERACRILASASAHEAAALTDAAREGLAGDGEVPSFEHWRARIRAHFTGAEDGPELPSSAIA
jgi:hypothetical protein